MNLLEYQGKKLFKESGIDVPNGEVVRSEEEAQKVFKKFPAGSAVKAQVHAGGRGKIGGVRLSRNEQELTVAVKTILGMEIKGQVVKEILLEEIIKIEKEFYMSFLVNSRNGNISFIFSTDGGMDIEEIAVKKPEKLFQWQISDISSVREYEIRNFLRNTGLYGNLLVETASVAYKLCCCFQKNDLILAEINPLVVTDNGNLMAADAKIEVDDNALYRHSEIQSLQQEAEDVFERQAKAIGISYVQMTGDVGIIASGAGLAMNSMDVLQSRGKKAANFLETGGGITADLIADSVELLLSNPSVNGILVNLYGGVNPMVEAAKGVIRGISNNMKNVAVVVKLLGNQQEAAWSILEEAGITIVKTVSTEKAVDLLLEKMEGRKAE